MANITVSFVDLCSKCTISIMWRVYYNHYRSTRGKRICQICKQMKDIQPHRLLCTRCGERHFKCTRCLVPLGIDIADRILPMNIMTNLTFDQVQRIIRLPLAKLNQFLQKVTYGIPIKLAVVQTLGEDVERETQFSFEQVRRFLQTTKSAFFFPMNNRE